MLDSEVVGTPGYIAPELLRKMSTSRLSKRSAKKGSTPEPMSAEMKSGLHDVRKLDVYSYGIILWEIFSGGNRPYENLRSVNEVLKAVVEDNLRPDLYLVEKDCTASIKELMCACWDTDPATRPTFRDIQRNLYEEKKVMMEK